MELYTGLGKKITVEAAPSGVGYAAPWITAIHRGWVAGARENTLPAMWLTKENGYHWAECDIRFTSDDVPVLAHDGTVTSEDGTVVLTVADSTAAQLKALTLQTHARFGAIGVATLKEVLDLARLIGLGLLLDCKDSHFDTVHNKILARTVLESGWADHVVYMPKKPEGAAAILEVDRNASFDFVEHAPGTVDTIPDLAPYQALLTGGNTVGFDINAGYVTNDDFPEVARTLREAGLNLSFWNVAASNCAAVMDLGPLRITKSNGADTSDLDALYFSKRQSW